MNIIICLCPISLYLDVILTHCKDRMLLLSNNNVEVEDNFCVLSFINDMLLRVTYQQLENK